MSAGFEPGDVASSYDAMAHHYAELFADELARNPSDRELLDRFADGLPGPGPVYDVGCGPGHVAAYLAGRGLDTVGVDLSAEMVSAARQRYPDVAFEQGDLRRPPNDRGPWAGAVAYYSLIHLQREALGAALAGIGAALAPSGRLLAIVHEGTGEIHVDEWRGRAVNLSATHFSEAEISTALVDAGFTVELLQTRLPYEWEYQRPKLQVLARIPPP